MCIEVKKINKVSLICFLFLNFFFFQNGKSIEVCGLFDVSVLNGLWTMLAGHRFMLNDAKLAKLMELVHVSFRMLDMSGGLLNQMPFIRFLAPKCSGYKEIKHILKEFYAFLKVIKNLLLSAVVFDFFLLLLIIA